jgi:hypothetical protein
MTTSRHRRDNRFLIAMGILFVLLSCAGMWLVWTAQVMH